MYDKRWADSILTGYRVYLLHASCKCSRVCKALDCQCVAYALKCLPACKNQLCYNMIDDDFEESFNHTTDEDESDHDDDENALNYKKRVSFMPG